MGLLPCLCSFRPPPPPGAMNIPILGLYRDVISEMCQFMKMEGMGGTLRFFFFWILWENGESSV